MTDDTSAPPLDLDAIEARIAACARLCAWEEGDGCREVATQRCAGGNCGLRLCEAHAEAHSNEAAHDTYPLPRNAVPEARALLAEVRRLRALRDDIADAFDGLVMKVWRAAGEEHEPPADAAALLRRVTALRESHRERSEALLTARRWADDAQRLLDAKEGTEREEELARTIWAEAEVRIAAARREGAEAMREACAKTCDRAAASLDAGAADDCDPDDPDTAADYGRFTEAVDLAGAIRALPLPGGEP